MKKTILHLIYSLGRGGAETMLVNVLKDLKHYNNIVVTLHPDNHFKNELFCDKYICLNQPRLRDLPLAAIALRNVIKSVKPDIVHSHLPFSNFTARLATPRHIPLITTIHTSIATAFDYRKWHIRLIDRLTYKLRESTIIAVSKGALKDYMSVLKINPGKTYLLHTFVNVDKYKEKLNPNAGATFKIISVGSLRDAKNYDYLIRSFKELKNQNIQLDIYGAGPLHEKLQKDIDSSEVPIFLKGQVNNINEILSQYDLFVMASLFEGFSLSVLEAMASKLPLMLSDIASFNEQCDDCAIYFDLSNPEDFSQKLMLLKSDKKLLENIAAKGHSRVLANFNITQHINKLNEIYMDHFKKRDINKEAGVHQKLKINNTNK